MKALRYPIRAVSKLTGISVDTLRAWERRYRVVEPERDERGRLYSEADLERLRLLHQAVGQGHAIGRVAGLSTDELKALSAHAPDGVPYDGPPAAGAPPDLAALQAAVERFDAAALRRELGRLAAVMPSRALARDVALPLLERVGQAWRDGRLSMAQEHLVSAELRSLIGALARLHAVPDQAPRLIFATPSGEPHELGTLVAALLASGHGFAACYLGPDLPAEEVLGAARRVLPKAVVLGFTGGDHAAGALAAVGEVVRGAPPDVECWVGGPGAAEARAALDGTRAVVIGDLDAYEQNLARLRGG